MKETFNYQSDANFYDKKDFIIAVLKRKINSFKEYDAERKKHYAGLEQKIKELQAKVNISLFDDTKSFEELESIANNLKNFNSMKLTNKGLRKQLKDNKNTISELIYKLTQAKLKIKQLIGE